MNDYDDDDRPMRRSSDRERTRKRVAAPALILIVFGALGLAVESVALVMAISDPTYLQTFCKEWIDNMPPGPEKAEWEQWYKESEADMRMDSPVNLGSYILGAVLSLSMLLGGIAMRSLGSYGLSLLGAIAGIIPLGGCCCCAMPFGIWAVIVLANEDVKAAFGRGSDMTPDPEY
jgi:hypothetical protein